MLGPCRLSTKSLTSMMFSWLMQLTACASAKKRLTASRFPENSDRSTLSATRRTHRIGPAGIAGREGARRLDAGVADDVRDSVIIVDDVVRVVFLARCLAGA